MEPYELKILVNSIRNLEKALGDGIKKPNKSEVKIKKVGRKSLVANCNIKSGTKITGQMIAYKRPGSGIAPGDIEKVLGLIIRKDKDKDEVIRWSDFK